MSNLPESLKYAKTHEWANLEDDKLVRVGITDFAQEELGDLVYVELPELGRIVTAGEQCAVVESVKTASDLYSPVSGEIIAINEAVTEQPERVNDDAYETWLFCVKTEDVSALEQLLNAEEYAQMIEE
ncbi:MAG: glycine cleavage system protein GcvH [Thiotrichaceae bacterium]|nr:glycine cleavage system protein GcvH [Thiotrichaceae bacterium]